MANEMTTRNAVREAVMGVTCIICGAQKGEACTGASGEWHYARVKSSAAYTPPLATSRITSLSSETKTEPPLCDCEPGSCVAFDSDYARCRKFEDENPPAVSASSPAAQSITPEELRTALKLYDEQALANDRPQPPKPIKSMTWKDLLDSRLEWMNYAKELESATPSNPPSPKTQDETVDRLAQFLCRKEIGLKFKTLDETLIEADRIWKRFIPEAEDILRFLNLKGTHND